MKARIPFVLLSIFSITLFECNNTNNGKDVGDDFEENTDDL